MTLLLAALAPATGRAAPYAAMVMDARTGEVLHSRNADTQLHPASLTKMMTLYIAFQAIERGEISLDDMVTITPLAANEPPSKLGLVTGQRIQFRYLIRAAGVKSANDAATAIGIALEGNEAAFARRMTATAQAMGMSRTTFRNAHGLTEAGHLSTARDMTVLGRHIIYDYPQYYNIFGRITTDAGVREVANTNRRFLNAYRGADGIKTGYTRAAGFNLVASAERGQERIIATMFGGSSTAARNARVAELLDMGFARAPSTARIDRPRPVGPQSAGADTPAPGTTARTVRVNGLVARSLRPQARAVPDVPEVAEALVAVNADAVQDVVADVIQTAAAAPEASEAPPSRPSDVVLAAVQQASPTPNEPEIVTRISTSGSRLWGVNVGRYGSRYQAERVLLRVALNEMSTLDGSLRRVNQSSRGFDANFMGLTRDGAERACARLQARGTTCFMIGPE
ncbi:D-alanyl-D-alanine carboxypeptidase family protein [Octadecabacter sp. 1_MG-2023]|uniref:D-alanyl-D-alanine carboxypeptidase family protein n=1 Tax=unclassified Octadecabacter TaxID=196158 RepID=UPI001C092906|nr:MULTISPECIES: D-alanyl-D-alanine carboxypeptidase family protein [unclassified Octadecabacter]MBU2994242.1 D-alanyl-D-alanine carboxypeptidase [Octadecabacter sp. B2R22]MDO6734469.1 D-alanyl-D-alanine carboxypeptidase family protein [Octadecabacter sp. 1_MG-2023]